MPTACCARCWDRAWHKPAGTGDFPSLLDGKGCKTVLLAQTSVRCPAWSPAKTSGALVARVSSAGSSGPSPPFARFRFLGPGRDSLPWAHTLLLPCRLSLRHPRLAELEPWFISPHIRTQEPPLALSTAGRRTTFPEPGQAPPTRVTIADLPLWPQIPSTPSILTLSTEPDAVLPRGNRAALPEPPASPPESLPEPPASLVSLPAPPTQRPGPAKPGACHSSAPTPTALIPRRGLVACDLRAWHPRLSPSTRQGLDAPPGGKDKVRTSPQSALHLHDLLTSSPSPSPPVPPPPPCPRPFAPAASSP